MVLHSEGLLPDWRDVVSYPGRRLLVKGVAGSGKTGLIAERFKWLVAQGLRPERMVLLAPSAASAQAMRQRLEGELEQPYERLFVLTAPELAGVVLDGGTGEALESVLGPGERLALLLEHIDELTLSHHDFGGSPNALLAGFVRRVDRLKAELVSAEDFWSWAAAADDSAELEFAEVYRAHERMLEVLEARDSGELLCDALRKVERRGHGFEHLLIDDAQELDLATARLAHALGDRAISVAGDPEQALTRFRGAGQERLREFEQGDVHTVVLERSARCPHAVAAAAGAVLGSEVVSLRGGGEVAFWRCANERAQAQSVAADVERLVARQGVAPDEVAVVVSTISREGRDAAVALEERAIPHRMVGEEAFFQRAEIRDLLAWLRLLANPADAGAVVRALARPPIDLRSVDIARCTQIARRRKLDMVAALAAALESPQVPPEARDRIVAFLKLYRSGVAAIDTTRPDLYVHRLIDRLGLRRQQLFAAQAEVVERLRALARFGELAARYVRRIPQATPREFVRSITAVAEFGSGEQEEPGWSASPAVQIVGFQAAGDVQADHVYVLGLHAGLAPPTSEVIPNELLHEPLPDEDDARRGVRLRQSLYTALTRSRNRLVLCYSAVSERGAAQAPSPLIDQARAALDGVWEEKQEELFGPAETLHSTYRLLRDELLESTMRVGGRLGELRFDTDLDVSHAVVRYLELLKLAALIARPEEEGIADAIRDVNSRILQAVTAEQREIFSSSALDDYLLDAERDTRRRTQAIAARDEPSLEPFLPKRGDGVVLSASDIDAYRTCPLKYKFARIFRIPQEPTINQRFGILIHQVLERFHASESRAGSLGELLGLLDVAWRRGGFGDSDEERQLHGKAASALNRYWERFQSEECEPVWFERQFTFKLGPHLLRGRVDRVDRLPGGEYELIDYKTSRPKSPGQLAEDVQLSLYAVGAREAWSLEASRQAYYYVLDDEKIAVPGNGGGRSDWVREVALEVAEGILSQGFEPTPSFAACSVCDYRLVCPAAER